MVTVLYCTINTVKPSMMPVQVCGACLQDGSWCEDEYEHAKQVVGTNECTCRCYEVQCVSGPVIGNYSGTSDRKLSLKDANPPYKNFSSHLNTTYPVDDKGTTFGGNSGEEQSLLTVQCHERDVSVNAVDCSLQTSGIIAYHKIVYAII